MACVCYFVARGACAVGRHAAAAAPVAGAQPRGALRELAAPEQTHQSDEGYALTKK